MPRTQLQLEANKLDLKMFQLAQRLDDFATKLHGSKISRIDETAAALRGARSIVRAEMHPDDVEDTK